MCTSVDNWSCTKNIYWAVKKFVFKYFFEVSLKMKHRTTESVHGLKMPDCSEFRQIFPTNMVICASRATFFIKHLYNFMRKEGTEKFPRVLAWLKNYNFIKFFFLLSKPRGISEESRFLGQSFPKWFKQKKKSNISLLKHRTNLVVICFWEKLPRQGAFRMTAQLSKPYITGSTFTICNSIKKKKFKIYRTCKLTLPIGH